MALFSTEAEFRAIANTNAEIIWLQHLCWDLNITLNCAPLMYYDNIGATYISSYLVLYACMKHIEIDYHFV